MTPLTSRFEQYGNWRDALARALVDLRQWLNDTQTLEGDAVRRLDVALDRLAEDKLVIAFVAEFSRGKSELINAIFFADCGRRILPSSAGRTTMCPTEILYDAASPPGIRALPIQTRARAGSTSDFKRLPAEWTVVSLDARAPYGMLDAFRMVAETIRVPVAEARAYGLFDPDDPGQAVAIDREGMVEIPRWRHAVINFPHPLLRRGLVVLDTPGLNAVGAEPELTLSLIPNAHAVLFVLAADAGVTRSDLDAWRHVVGSAGHRNHLAVLNKIDGLWDPLKSAAEIEGEVERQVGSAATMLEIGRERVFPVSAQKGLVAKLHGDDALLQASRLPHLEEALVDVLVPGKQRIVRDQTVGAAERVLDELRHALTARERGVMEQLYELRSLQGKNQSSIERMSRRAGVEQREFEEVVRRLVAARQVLSRLSDEMFRPLRVSALREHVLVTRSRMKGSRLSSQLTASMRAYFAGMRDMLREANAKTLEIEQMTLGVQRRFAEDLGWALSPPMPFSLDSYIADVDRAEAACRDRFGGFAVLTTDKWSLMQRFLDTVVAQSLEVFAAAGRDAEAWAKSLLPPLEMQVREQRSQLKKRAESVARIRDAQGSLDERIAELEEALEEAQSRLAEVKRMAERIREIGARARVESLIDPQPLAA